VNAGYPVVVHADESCLGNGRDGLTPGGSAALIETRNRSGVVRRDLYISAPDTTNNRMALAGAIAALALLSGKGQRLDVTFVSDSEYLVKGMREWVPSWRARGWRRKGGAIENLELWQTLARVAAAHDVTWQWVRGHSGHAKNEYANDLAMRAAEQQMMSDGAVDSGFPAWLDEHRRRGQFTEYDPDAAYEALAQGASGG